MASTSKAKSTLPNPKTKPIGEGESLYVINVLHYDPTRPKLSAQGDHWYSSVYPKVLILTETGLRAKLAEIKKQENADMSCGGLISFPSLRKKIRVRKVQVLDELWTDV